MATSFDVIGQRALSVIDDYKLRKLYDANIELFHDKIDGWIVSSAAKFIECEKKKKNCFQRTARVHKIYYGASLQL